MREQLDKVDLQIIRLLQNDGRMASSEIAKTIRPGLQRTAIFLKRILR